ncbi:hypothetical protein D9615_010105 [Tricholomella constricta]|uniref:Uncharacterized protein n=1 Tax=Tricholomella constricta TaxID=117010 RepID=A0A8H5GXG7_9AGAR|nr:hypothetical protein D9615_010105 [Tricholomella constricta]
MVNMKSATENRKPYSGLTRSLVIAIDVGTTFSGVSYAILEPGEIPKIHGVTRFPGQEHVAGNSKIPSIIYYDKHGKMMAAGAEAETTSVLAQAEDEGWIKTELFKLRLRPRTMQLNMNGMRLGPLPRRKTAVHVFGDFLAYLYRCTRNFITDTHGNGAALWNAVEHNIQFVLSHPNGWEGAQQTKMRRSAVYGGLIPDTNEGKARIRFVTEGEASLHACVLNGLAADVLSNPSKHGFLIADAGGGTLDISAYAIRGTAPLVMEEIAPPDCIFAGSVFVSRRAREFLEEKLKNSKYGTPAALDHITQRFDETTKRLFRDRKDLQFIPFGSPLDKDLTVGIRGGQLKLTGNEVANLFEPSVDAASVFLVGGYAASPWLFNQLQERLAPYSITVSRPDTQTSKAVADGAIGFYCDHHVSARMSKFMYGVEFLRELDPMNPDHVARKERLCELPSGPKLLPDAFDCILNRGVKVKESTVFTRKYCTELTSLSMLSVFEVEIWCYRGGNIVPKWIDRQADDFSTLCVVRADLSPLSGSAESKAGRNGKTYWTIVFSVEIHFGLTEFRARIKWVDDGKTKYGPASIVYNERGHRADEEEPDMYPEDDAATSSPRNDRLRSEPASRARTPVEQFYHPSSNGGIEISPPKPPVEIPQVHREDTPSMSKGLLSPSGAFPAESSRDISRSVDPPKEPETPQDKRKGKGKEKVSKATPKVEDTLPPPVEPAARTPQLADTLSSSLWATDPIQPAAEMKSPSLGLGSSTPSSKEKEKPNTTNTTTSKTSPAILGNRSPLGLSEPIVASEVVPPAATATSPGGILSSAKASPASTKKGKKKGSVSLAATPAIEPVEPPAPAADSTPAKEAPVLTPDEPKVSAAPPTAPEEPPVSTEKPASNILTPVGLPEVTLSTKTPEPGSLTISEDLTSSLFGTDSAWGNNGDTGVKDGFDSWGSFGITPKTPKSRQSPKTPVAEAIKVEEFPEEASTAAPKAPETKAENKSPWGAASKTPDMKPAVESAATTPAKTAGIGWGAPAKKTGWGAAPSASASTSLGWGSSFGAAKTPEAKTFGTKSPRGSKPSTPITTKASASPWSSELATKEEEPKEESKLADEPAPAHNQASGEAAAAVISAPIGKDKVATPKADAADIPPMGEASGATPDADEAKPANATIQEAAAAEKVPTPKPSPKAEEKPLDPVPESEIPADVISPTTETGEDAEDKEEKKDAGGTKKAGAGGGGAAGKKKKKKK